MNEFGKWSVADATEIILWAMNENFHECLCSKYIWVLEPTCTTCMYKVALENHLQQKQLQNPAFFRWSLRARNKRNPLLLFHFYSLMNETFCQSSRMPHKMCTFPKKRNWKVLWKLFCFSWWGSKSICRSYMECPSNICCSFVSSWMSFFLISTTRRCTPTLLSQVNRCAERSQELKAIRKWHVTWNLPLFFAPLLAFWLLIPDCFVLTFTSTVTSCLSLSPISSLCEDNNYRYKVLLV